MFLTNLGCTQGSSCSSWRSLLDSRFLAIVQAYANDDDGEINQQLCIFLFIISYVNRRERNVWDNFPSYHASTMYVYFSSCKLN